MNRSAFRLSAVFLIAFSMVALLFAFLPAFAIQLPLFSDDFEDGVADGWTVQAGNWSVITDGTKVYNQIATTVTARSVTGSSSWTDYSIQSTVKLVSIGTGTTYAMLMARYQNQQNYYFMAVRSNNRIEIKKQTPAGSGSALSSAAYSITLGTWYTATFEANGNVLRGYINGTPVVTATDTTTTPLVSGLVGVGTSNTNAEFDDVLVTDLRAFTLTVSSTGNGTGSISSDPAGISCGATCSAVFDANNVVTLTATPDVGSSFAGWLSACVGKAACVVTMDAAKSVVAVFSLDTQPMLVVNTGGNGNGLVTSDPAGIDCGITCTASFAQNTVVTLTAAAAGDSLFTGWSGEGCNGTGACIVTMDTAKNVTATFTLQIFALNVTKSGNGSGTVTSNPAGINCGATCSANYNAGTVVTLTAAPTTGSTFTGWTGSGCSGAGTCAITIDAAKSVTATFDLITYTLTANRAGNGFGSINSTPAGINNCTAATCSAIFNYDTIVTLTASANLGSTFNGWSGASCSGTGTCVVTMDAAKTVTATMSLLTYTLSVNTTGSGTGSVASVPAGISCGATCTASFDYGTVVTLTAAADVGSSFAGWTGAGCLGTRDCVVTMDAAKSVIAIFSSASNPMLVVYTGGNGTGTVTSTPAGIDCGITCTASFAQNTVVTLTATPGPNTLFGGWCGACSGTGPCVLTMNEAKNVRAVFIDTSAILFQDDFEGGAGQWTVQSGTWSVVVDGTNVYSQSTATDFARSVISNTQTAGWTDYTFRARVKPGAGQYAMLMVRYQNANNHYFMNLRTDNGKIEIKKMVNGSSGSALRSVNANITAGTWYTAELEVVGTQLRGYLNGTLVITATDPLVTSPFMTGGVGVGTLNNSAEFDDAVVSSLAPLYTLSVYHTGTGTGTVSSVPAGIDCDLMCVAGLNGGAVVTLTATPDPGSTFAGWLGAGCIGTSECVITMDASKSVTAVFSAASQPMLVVNKTGNGTGLVTSVPTGIDCGPTCAAGFSPGVIVTLTATATNYSTFMGWSGASCSGTGTCSVTMDAAKSVTATFMYFTYPLTVTKAGSGLGMVTSEPAGINCGITCTANFGGVVTLTATPNMVTQFTGWTGACSGTGPCVILMDAAKSVTATFTQYKMYFPILRNYIAPVTVAPVYVAINGSDSNPGTIALPFKTLNKAIAQTTPGQTIYVRGGTYFYSDTITLTKNANNVNMYKIWAYGNEKPVLDFSGSPFGARGFTLTGYYWHLKGLEIRYAQDNAIKIEGSYNIVENCVLHHNEDTGLQIGLATESVNPGGQLAAYNQVINCDSYRNFDSTTNGSNADGFAAKLHPGPGNVFKGDRSWENADDGWDMFLTDYPVIVENSWTWHNGDRTLFGNPSSWGGNGNGFKVGGGNNHAAHILKNCIAFDHKYGSGSATKGFDQNHNFSGVTIYNSVAWDNTINYSFYEQPDDGTHHILKNNVGFNWVNSNVNLSADTIQASNSWILTATVTADAADFLSLAASLAQALRQADGSLPNNDFARLVSGSDLIDQGVDVGIPYCGAAPDLGAFERCP